jgi:hypothetical protein
MLLSRRKLKITSNRNEHNNRRAQRPLPIIAIFRQDGTATTAIPHNSPRVAPQYYQGEEREGNNNNGRECEFR